jgi:hypothetical protein
MGLQRFAIRRFLNRVEDIFAWITEHAPIMEDTRNALDDRVPVGTVATFGFTPDANEWLPCDGAAVSRDTYDDLFAQVGTTFGVGDGLTTFNVPTIAVVVTNVGYFIKT